MKLTDAIAAALELPPGKAEHFAWDTALPGFGIRIRASGAKRWVIQYRANGRQHREALGDIRKVRCIAAQRVARERFARVELGGNPAADRAHAAAAARQTIRSLVELYLTAKQGEMRPGSWRAMRHHLQSHWKALHHSPIAAVTRTDVAAILMKISTDRGRIAAARARANLSAMFGWAIRAGMCSANPVVGTVNWGAKPRERTLTNAELRSIWRACLDDTFGRAIKLLILCGGRRAEIGDLRWEEIDLDSGVLTIPAARTKAGRALALTLPEMALEILRTTPRQPGQPFVFGKRGRAGFNAWHHHLNLLGARIEAAGETVAPWRIHDLRRTVRSGLGELGIAPHVAEAAIGHFQRGIVAVYDKYSYRAEIKTALARWADRVAAVVNNRQNNVVPMRGGA